MEAHAALLSDLRLQEEVVGARLGFWPNRKPREPSDLIVPELKRRLVCRGARRVINKAELVERQDAALGFVRVERRR